MAPTAMVEPSPGRPGKRSRDGIAAPTRTSIVEAARGPTRTSRARHWARRASLPRFRGARPISARTFAIVGGQGAGEPFDFLQHPARRAASSPPDRPALADRRRRRRASGDGRGRYRDPRGRRVGRRRRRRRLLRLVRRRDRHDRAARRAGTRSTEAAPAPSGTSTASSTSLRVSGVSSSSSQVPFGEELVHYAVGPGVLRGARRPGRPRCAVALVRALPWPRLVEPALALARGGGPRAARPRDLAMLAPVFTLTARAPDLRARRPPSRPASGSSSRASRARSRRSRRRARRPSTAARSPTRSRRDRRRRRNPRPTSRATRRAGRAREVAYAGTRFFTAAASRRARRSQGYRRSRRPPAERVLALGSAHGLDGRRRGHTTNVVTADPDGRACVVTTSLGLGTGDFVPASTSS